MTRVLHLVSDTSRRGAQVFAEQLHHSLRTNHGIDGGLVALEPGIGAAVGAVVAPASQSGRRRMMADYDLVIAHGSTTLDAAALHARGRFIYRSIGDPRFWLDRPRRRIKTRLALARATSVVALYPDAGHALCGLAGVASEEVVVIPNAVEVDTADVPAAARTDLGVAADERAALFVGSLSWEKRVDLIVEAVSQTHDLHLIVIGTGPLEAEVDALGAELLGSRYHHIGPLTDVRPFYAIADVLTLASVTEGQPGTILEAAAFGVPTVAAPVGGVPDMLRDLGAGACADPENATAFGAALVEAATKSDGDARDPLPVTATMETVATKWAELIRTTTATR